MAMPIKRWRVIVAACFFIIAILIIAFPLRPYIKNRFLDTPFGEYSFIIHDTTGYKAAEGHITITFFQNNAVRGDWRLRYYESTDTRFKLFSGQEIVSKFVGGYKGDDININLNPLGFDANDILIGKIKHGKIVGEFRFYGYDHINSLGTFEAIRK